MLLAVLSFERICAAISGLSLVRRPGHEGLSGWNLEAGVVWDGNHPPVFHGPHPLLHFLCRAGLHHLLATCAGRHNSCFSQEHETAETWQSGGSVFSGSWGGSVFSGSQGLCLFHFIV